LLDAASGLGSHRFPLEAETASQLTGSLPNLNYPLLIERRT
jgi:hypothetical protein